MWQRKMSTDVVVTVNVVDTPAASIWERLRRTVTFMYGYLAIFGKKKTPLSPEHG
jgi:hypothetical protein